MILDYVSNGAGFIVESTTALHPEIFGHCDLHAFDVVAIPERLHESIGEAEQEHIAHWPLSKVVVNTKNVALGKGCVQDPVQLLGRLQVASKRLFNNDASTVGGSGVREMFDDGSKQRRRNGQVMCRMLSTTKLFAKRVKGCAV